MKKRPFLAATGLALLAVTSVVYLFPAAQQPTLAPAAAQPAPVAGQLVQPARQRITELSAARYMTDVTFLARDEMKGRGSGTPELEIAADYIAEQFRLAGLTPKGENGTYFQPFEVTTGAQLGAKNELAIAGAALKINDDFVPIMISNTAEFEGPLVFAGYGISAPELNYDDYAGHRREGQDRRRAAPRAAGKQRAEQIRRRELHAPCAVRRQGDQCTAARREGHRLPQRSFASG